MAFKDRATGVWRHFTGADLEERPLDASTLDLRNVIFFAPDSETESRLFKKRER